MDSLVRLMLRFILVPLGYLAAVGAGACVILFGSWRLGEFMASPNPDDQGVAALGFVFAGSVLFVLLLAVMWLPSAIGILVAEAFALRSWIYHAGNGAVSAWLGWNLFGSIDDSRVPINDPLPVIAAGLAGGFVYWIIAGSSAGFWKPVFARAAPPQGTASAPAAADAATPR
jgi:hypothetical protein